MEQLIASLLAERQGQQQQQQQQQLQVPQQHSRAPATVQQQQIQLRDLQQLSQSDHQLLLPLLRQTLASQVQDQNQQGLRHQGLAQQPPPQQHPNPSAARSETAQAKAPQQKHQQQESATKPASIENQLLCAQQHHGQPGVFTSAAAARSHLQSSSSQAPSLDAQHFEELFRGLVGKAAVSSAATAAASAQASLPASSEVSYLLRQLVDQQVTRSVPVPAPLPAAEAPRPKSKIKDIILELVVQIISIGDSGQMEEIGDLLIRLGTLLRQGSLSNQPLEQQAIHLPNNHAAALLATSSGIPAHQAPHSVSNGSLPSSQATLATSGSDQMQQLQFLLQQAQAPPQQPQNGTLAAPSVASRNQGSFADSSRSAVSHPPVDEVSNPGQHDVLLGRGSGASNHLGNIRYRTLIEQYKPRYNAATRIDKPKIADEIVTVWRGLIPPGRFLARADDDDDLSKDDDYTTGRWRDVGDARAKTKTCQCLREKERPPRQSRKAIAATATATTTTDE